MDGGKNRSPACVTGRVPWMNWFTGGGSGARGREEPAVVFSMRNGSGLD